MGSGPPREAEPVALDAPYPLLRRFLGRILPGAAVFAAAAAALLGGAVNRVIEGVYLEIAEVRAQGILRSIHNAMPALVAGQLGESDVRALTRFLAAMPGKPRLQRIKIYDLSRAFCSVPAPPSWGAPRTTRPSGR